MATTAVLRGLVSVEGAEASAAKLGMFGAKVDSVARMSGGSMTKMGVAGSIAFAGLGVAAGVGIGKAVEATVNLGTETLKLSRILGTSAEDASRLIAVGHELGVGYDALSRSLSLYEKNLVNGGKAVTQYGLSLTNADGSQKDFNQLLGEASDKYLSLAPGAERAAFALNAFGRGGRELIPILAQGSDRIAEMAKQSDALGTTMSGKDVQASFALARAQRELQQAFLGVEVSLGKGFLPILTSGAHVLEMFLQVVNLIPGPVKTMAFGLVALAGAIKGAQIAAAFFRGTLGTLIGSLTGTVAAEEAATVATGELAVAEGVATGALAGLGGALGVAAGGAVVFVAALIAANNEALKQDAILNSDITAVRNFGTETKAGTNAQKDFGDAMRRNFGRLAGFNATAAEYRDRMNAATRATRGLTEAQIANMRAASNAATREAAFMNTIHRVTGAEDAATRKAVALKAAIDALHDKSITVEVLYQVQNFPGYGRGNRAEGGMVYMAPGGSPPVVELTRPTMIAPGVQAGEGGREFVLPGNQRGSMWIENAVERGVSKAYARAGALGGGGEQIVHVHVDLDGHEIASAIQQMGYRRGKWS